MSACVALVACGSDDDDAPPTDADVDGPADPSEECLPNTPEFSYGPTGLSQAAATGQFSVRIEDAEYAPPAKNFNDWTLQISDASGMPMPQARLVWACAWMPAHLHGSVPKGIMKLDGGKYVLKSQNLSMYGGWQVKLWIDPAGTLPDFVPGSTAGAVGRDACMPTLAAITQDANIQFTVCVPRQRGSS